MKKLASFLENLLGPLFRPVSRWLAHPERKHPTWHYEALVVALILFGVAALTTNWSIVFSQPLTAWWRPFIINWLVAAAVLISFLQAQVGFRMAEAQNISKSRSVDCHMWSGRYWISKELLWFIVFFLSGAFSAIAGNVVFLLYPAWRQIHVKERMKMRKGGDK